MVVMTIKHQVRSYGDWKSVFDTFPPTAGGALFHRVNQAVDDGNTVMVEAGFSSLDDAVEFRENPELKAKMEAAGVVGPPRFEIYEEVEAVQS